MIQSKAPHVRTRCRHELWKRPNGVPLSLLATAATSTQWSYCPVSKGSLWKRGVFRIWPQTFGNSWLKTFDRRSLETPRDKKSPVGGSLCSCLCNRLISSVKLQKQRYLGCRYQPNIPLRPA
jgi:hypothetical protein